MVWVLRIIQPVEIALNLIHILFLHIPSADRKYIKLFQQVSPTFRLCQAGSALVA